MILSKKNKPIEVISLRDALTVVQQKRYYSHKLLCADWNPANPKLCNSYNEFFNKDIPITFKVLYEYLWIQLVKIENIYRRMNFQQTEWIMAHPINTQLIHMSHSGAALCRNTTDPNIKYEGTLCSKWRIFTSKLFPEDVILMGNGTELKNKPNQYGLIKVIK